MESYKNKDIGKNMIFQMNTTTRLFKAWIFAVDECIFRYWWSVASFTLEVNLRLAKRPLKTNGSLANHGLTSLVKEAIGVYLAILCIYVLTSSQYISHTAIHNVYVCVGTGGDPDLTAILVPIFVVGSCVLFSILCCCCRKRGITFKKIGP